LLAAVVVVVLFQAVVVLVVSSPSLLSLLPRQIIRLQLALAARALLQVVSVLVQLVAILNLVL
jgi:hypothetical protein